MQNTKNAIEANKLQKMWMDLDSNGPKSEIDRVIREYSKVPTSYIAQSDSGLANVMIQCQPTTSGNITIAEAELLAKKYNVQTSLRWNTKGYFFNA